MAKTIDLHLLLIGSETGLSGLRGKIKGLGEDLMQLGAFVDQVGGKARDLEKNSLEVYKNYETYMLEAKGALSSQYRNTYELNQVMDGLDKKASEWASTTIFHTNDVSQAISEAAHAGWSYEEMLEGIPNAMLLAQAGNLSLSSGLDYLIKTLNGTDTAFEDSRELVDQWVMAANSSATNVEELGDAFLRMGATARFADGNAELLTLLGALADAGTVGASAGTLLRNGMIRLIAPTDKASQAMSILGATTEEIEEALADSSIKQAAKELDALGFSAFDNEGNLRPFLDIFHELDDVTRDLTEERRDQLLSAIFPTRTITGALTILDAMDRVDDLYEKISTSKGYAQDVAKIQMSGLMGAQETFYSKTEEFSRKLGKTLSGPMETLYEIGGGFFDWLNAMDDGKMAAFTGALTTLAAAGPTLLGIGAAMKVFGLLGTTGTAIVATITAIGALAGYLTEISNADYSSSFGTLEADLQSLSTYLDEMPSKFEEQQQSLSKWTEGVSKAQSDYEAALKGFSETLLTDVLTGRQLEEKDIEALKGWGDQMGSAVRDGINAALARDLTFLDDTMGSPASSADAQAFENATAWIDIYYNAQEEKLTAANARLNELISQLQKNNTQELRQEIQKQVAEMNAINADISNMDRQADYEMQLLRAGRISWDSASNVFEELTGGYETRQQEINDLWDYQIARTRVAYDKAREKGDQFYYKDSYGYGHWVDTTEKAWSDVEAILEQSRQAALAENTRNLGNVAARAFDVLLGDNAGYAWNYLKDLYDKGAFDENGALAEGFKDFGEYDPQRLMEGAGELNKILTRAHDLLDPFAENPEVARMLDVTNLTPWLDAFTSQTTSPMLDQALADSLLAPYIESLENAIATKGDRVKDIDARLDELYKDNEQAQHTASGFVNGMTSADRLAEIDKLQKEKAEVEKEINALQAEMKETLEAAQGDIQDIAGADYPGEIIFTTNTDEVAAAASAAAAGPYGGVIHFQSVIDGVEGATGGGQSAKSGGVLGGIAKSVSNTLSTLKSSFKLPFFEEGGRSDQAAIFGEGDTAEWAIPEKHEQRTADLLDMARRASGFTWPELIARTGGLNAGSGDVHVHLGSYAPVIHAENADGVERALLRDKERLQRVIQDAVKAAMANGRLRDSVEIYV